MSKLKAVYNIRVNEFNQQIQVVKIETFKYIKKRAYSLIEL